MDADIFVSQHLHLDTPLTAKPLSWWYQVNWKWFSVKDWYSTGSISMDSAVFVATLPVSQKNYWHSTGSVATNTALSVATVSTNKHHTHQYWHQYQPQVQQWHQQQYYRQLQHHHQQQYQYDWINNKPNKFFFQERFIYINISLPFIQVV